MQTLPADLLELIVVFQPLFTKPTWEHAKILLLGALLARGNARGPPVCGWSVSRMMNTFRSVSHNP
jgi:hypothetical protein